MDSNVNKNEMPANSVSDYLDLLRESMGSNRDSKGLGAMSVGPFVIGNVDTICGEEGEEVPEFAATRHELKQLAEHWALERMEHDFYWFVCQCTGSSEWRWSVYIDRRLNRLSELLGPEAMQKVLNAAVASFRKHRPKLTDEDWRIFTKGTETEQEAWRTQALGDFEAAE